MIPVPPLKAKIFALEGELMDLENKGFGGMDDAYKHLDYLKKDMDGILPHEVYEETGTDHEKHPQGIIRTEPPPEITDDVLSTDNLGDDQRRSATSS